MSKEMKPSIIAIDDNQYYLNEISMEIDKEKYDLCTFLGPDAFEEDLLQQDIDRAKLILIDYDFRTCSVIDRGLVPYIREKYPKYKGKIVLLSVSEDFLQDKQIIDNQFDGIINKKGMSWNNFQKYLNF